MRGLTTNTDHREIILAAGLIAVLSISALSIYPFMVPASNEKHYSHWSAYAFIAIDGDANFSDTALLEGWAGDGSPENPYIIDGLNIDPVDAVGHGISISNTRVSFTIRNCNITGFVSHHGDFCEGGAGIYLENVTNGQLVNNTCTSNSYGIDIWGSYSNTMVNNTCNNNSWTGISLEWSNSNTMANNICSNNTDFGIFLDDISFNNTVVNNTCINNRIGIFFYESDSNTVADNTCDSNTEYGIYLYESHFSSVVNNICNNNRIGIFLEDSESNTVDSNTCNNNRIGISLDESFYNAGSNNTFLDNTKHDMIGEFVDLELAYRESVAREFVWLLAGCGMILVVSVIALLLFRRMEIHRE
ncbi:MAG: nitrous oxide reductase family maturation protein NosD [Promethearchaeota archaeon]